MIGDRWGVTDDEVDRSYPCDDLVPSPSLQAWRGVTVLTTPEILWPWVTQIQRAPYSYDWIDNIGHHSPQRLLDVPAPAPGQHFTSTAGRPRGCLLSVEPQMHYTGRIIGITMSYVLAPVDENSTRLLLKLVMSGHRRLAPFLSAGDLVMARRQLLNLKRLAEKHSISLLTHCNTSGKETSLPQMKTSANTASLPQLETSGCLTRCSRRD